MLHLAKVSSGLTVFAAAGFLIGAILTDNGGTNSQSQIAPAETLAKVSATDAPSNGKIGNSGALDRIITSGINRVKTVKVEPVSMEQLIGENQGDDAEPKSTVNKSFKQASAPSGTVVTVQPGDTLFRIGLKHGLTVNEIAAINGLDDPFTIRPGQKLVVAR